MQAAKLIVVSDNGIGFDSNMLKDQFEGTGLGLSLKKLYKVMGRNHRGQSVHEDGAAFMIRLPKRQRVGRVYVNVLWR